MQMQNRAWQFHVCSEICTFHAQNSSVSVLVFTILKILKTKRFWSFYLNGPCGEFNSNGWFWLQIEFISRKSDKEIDWVDFQDLIQTSKYTKWILKLLEFLWKVLCTIVNTTTLYLDKRFDFPTPESPIKTTLNK